MWKKKVTLGLQGGGSHGAYTWGVLDRLLEDERIEIEGVSGASAGAMNAVALAHGLATGGRAGARAALREFWETVAKSSPFSSPRDDAGADPTDMHTSTMRALRAFVPWTRVLSPYQLNPFDVNPLRDIVSRQFDFERLRRASPIKLFIATTRVSDGVLRLFHADELSADALLASACLPTLHHSIEIDGEAYWDGGLSANPPVFPLVHQCDADDVVLVLLDPAVRPGVPKTVDAIGARLTEISFSSTLFTELQGIALLKHEAQRDRFAFGRLVRRMRRLSLHVIDSKEFMAQLESLSRVNTDAGFIAALFDEGRRRADAWLGENFRHVGARSSFDLQRLLSAPARG